MRGGGFFVARFVNEEDMKVVIEGEPWLMGGRPIVLRKWNRGMKLEMERLETIPIWIRLPHLPLHLWGTRMLSKLSSVIGTPLYMDSSTSSRSRIEFARICVEISASSPLPDLIRLKEDGVVKEITVEYEWKPSPCRTCNTFGHTEAQCPMPRGTNLQEAAKTRAVISMGHQANPSMGKEPGKQKQVWIPVKEGGTKRPTHSNGPSLTTQQANPFSLLPVEEEELTLIKDPSASLETEDADSVSRTGKETPPHTQSIVNQVRTHQAEESLPSTPSSENPHNLIEGDTLQISSEVIELTNTQVPTIGEDPKAPEKAKTCEEQVNELPYSSIDIIVELSDDPPPSQNLRSSRSASTRSKTTIEATTHRNPEVIVSSTDGTNRGGSVSITSKTKRGKNPSDSGPQVKKSTRGESWSSQSTHQTTELKGSLWDSIKSISSTISSSGWIVGGDFNEVRFSSEKVGGQSVHSRRLHKFNSCLLSSGLEDLKSFGNTLSWTNRQSNPIMCRLDRALGNQNFILIFPHSLVKYLPSGISDHSPVKVILEPPFPSGPKPFKYFEAWKEHNSFSQLVHNAWKTDVIGNPMYQFIKKLSNTKSAIKFWNREVYGPIQSHVACCKKDLEEAQKSLHNDPSNNSNSAKEKELRLIYHGLLSQEEKFARQKSRQLWLEAGDSNSKFFYNSIKSRSIRNTICQLQKTDGSLCSDPEDVKDYIVQYYKELLNRNVFEEVPLPPPIGMVSDNENAILCATVEPKEIRSAVFSLKALSSPGPDGFPARFYQSFWYLIQEDLTKAITPNQTVGLGIEWGERLAENQTLGFEIKVRPTSIANEIAAITGKFQLSGRKTHKPKPRA
ncbi:hypothetical protein QJS10_CPA09g00850 [Acorus calamus]|uniref:DUF4283 domain-containing protein n=1 Tax=Acorus calamus TaxID=4465 RepID=A0AAV9E4C0_ACOCL|nr:hypothetical protein QJS10_CPA09g00850 [Acorus calamus]